MGVAGIEATNSDVYQSSAYRSDAIPIQRSGGHQKLDKLYQRLAWGHYQTPIVPNTLEAQLAYANLFKDEADAEDGFPWGEKKIAIGKGFLSGLQAFLHVVYMGAKLLFFISFIALFVATISVIINNLTASGFYKLFFSFLYWYMIIGFLYFGAKYGRLLLARLTEKRQRANPTGLYRHEGLVRISTGDEVFAAPFIEFDAYCVHSPSGRGGRYYNLVLQHRYSDEQLWMKGLVADVMKRQDVYAYWDMVQQFMDVSHPLPDVPVLEPFRHRDPVTAEADALSRRDPFKWRKITPESWRENYESKYRARLMNANWNRPCIMDARIEGRGIPIKDEPRGRMLA